MLIGYKKKVGFFFRSVLSRMAGRNNLQFNRIAHYLGTDRFDKINDYDNNNHNTTTIIMVAEYVDHLLLFDCG